jgi:hypothetical protein
MVRWLIGGLAATVMFTGVALAEEMTGAVEEIDLTSMRMTVDGQVFNVSPENVVGSTLEELEVGDTVTVTYQGEPGLPTYNAMTIEKAE